MAGSDCFNLAMVFDDNFITPAMVTITSLLVNKNPSVKYQIHVCTPGLSEENRTYLREFTRGKWNTQINFVDCSVEKYHSVYSQYNGNVGAGSITALIKFDLPNLLDCDNVLYLDSDLIVRKDISDIFSCNLEGVYGATVIDSGRLYNNSGLRASIKDYFNSGVMFLNLGLMRQDNVEKELMNAKASLKNEKLVDQDAFNIVFRGKTVNLPIEYNCLLVNLYNSAGKFNIRELNELYETSYSCLHDLHDSTRIVHYASKEKPWKYVDAPYRFEWYSYYCLSPCKLPLGTDTWEKKCVVPVEIPIVLATDTNYLAQTAVTITSALANRTCSAKYSFYILTDSEIDLTSKKKFQDMSDRYGNTTISIVLIGEDAFSDSKLSISHITKPTFYRLLMSSLFPNYERMIYLDSDVVVEWDLAEYFNIDMGKNYILGVKAPSYHWATNGNKQYCKNNGLPAIDQYVNAGVLQFNLKNLRESNIEAEFIRLSKLGLRSQDQDVINRACYGRILHVHYRYNCMVAKYEKSPEQPLKIFSLAEINESNNLPFIIHYAAETKPWADLSCPLADRWWNYSKLSGFNDYIVSKYYDSLIENGKKERLSRKLNTNERPSACCDNILHQSLLTKLRLWGLKKMNKSINIEELVSEFDEIYKSSDKDAKRKLFKK